MPSTFLDAQQITRRYGARTVLDAVDVRVSTRSRIGLVGPNGAGKSTLLRVLGGRETPDRGVVRRFGTVGYLPQFADLRDRRLTVREIVLAQVGLVAAVGALDRWAAALAAGDLRAVDPHGAALERWLALGGADADARLVAAVRDLGLLTEFLERPVGTLSGGQAARAGLAALQVARFDVVLLDEPTNHLDADGLGRLAKLLSDFPGAVVLVSHDRALLAETVDEIVELDRETGKATRYRGGWDAFAREREAARERARAVHANALARRDQLIAAERETRRRAAASAKRARRGVHDNDKHSHEWVKMRAEEMAARARKIGGRAGRIDIPDAPRELPSLRLRLTAAERRTAWVVELEGVVLHRGGWSLGPLDLAVARGERVLISGPNGSRASRRCSPRSRATPLRAAGSRRVAKDAVIVQLGQARQTSSGSAVLADRVRELTRARCGARPAPRWPLSGLAPIWRLAAWRHCRRASARVRSSRSSHTSEPPVYCSTSPPTTLTSSRSRCSRQRWSPGREL